MFPKTLTTGGDMEFKQSPIGYLKKMLNEKGDFLQEYKRLNESDRLEMKEWAKEEMTVKGIQFILTSQDITPSK